MPTPGRAAPRLPAPECFCCGVLTERVPACLCVCARERQRAREGGGKGRACETEPPPQDLFKLQAPVDPCSCPAPGTGAPGQGRGGTGHLGGCLAFPQMAAWHIPASSVSVEALTSLRAWGLGALAQQETGSVPFLQEELGFRAKEKSGLGARERARQECPRDAMHAQVRGQALSELPPGWLNCKPAVCTGLSAPPDPCGQVRLGPRGSPHCPPGAPPSSPMVHLDQA